MTEELHLAPNTKSPTLETLINGYYEDPASQTGLTIEPVPEADAEAIRFNAKQVVATVWRPMLDKQFSDKWRADWDPEQQVRMRFFLHGINKAFRFNGIETADIQLDMLEDGELRPVHRGDDGKSHQGQPVSEKYMMGMLTEEIIPAS